MKKKSTYMKRREAQGKVQSGRVMFKPNAWLERIKFSTSYGDESIASEEPTTKIADKVMLDVRMALQKLTDGLVDSNDTECHDLLSHCVGMAQIRIQEIGGDCSNEIIGELNEGAQALSRARERWHKTGKWGLDGPAIHSLRYCIDTYEVVLRSSSPNQMETAQEIRLERVKRLQNLKT